MSPSKSSEEVSEVIGSPARGERAPLTEPWTPDQPLRADATDEQLKMRAAQYRYGRVPHDAIRTMDAADVLTAREFADACVSAGAARGEAPPAVIFDEVWPHLEPVIRSRLSADTFVRVLATVNDVIRRKSGSRGEAPTSCAFCKDSGIAPWIMGDYLRPCGFCEKGREIEEARLCRDVGGDPLEANPPRTKPAIAVSELNPRTSPQISSASKEVAGEVSGGRGEAVPPTTEQT